MNLYFVVSESGSVVRRLFWNGSDPLPTNAVGSDLLEDHQLDYPEHLSWDGKTWLYAGPTKEEIEVARANAPAPPDPAQAKRDALAAVGINDEALQKQFIEAFGQ